MRPFEREMRRRLWNMIGLLDIQGCLDRACEPMMQGNWIRIHPPSNINDDDLSPDTSVFRPSPEGKFTDMTFSLMLFNAQCTVRSLNFSDWAEPGVRGFKRRQEIVTSFHEETSKLLKQCPINGSPLQWYTKEVSDFIYASLQLIAVRPLQRDPMFTPPLVPNDVLLKLAVEVLERSHRLYQDPRGTSFRWFGNLFVPWHPLAVAIAESCVCSDHLLMSRVWPLIEQSYRSFKSLVADAPDGMLWKPMTRFMDRARNHQARLSETSNVLAQSQISETLSNVAGSSSNTFSSIQWPTQTQPNQSANVEVRQETDAVLVDQSMPVNTTSLWPDMWYPGELDGITLGATDEAWMNYESFMANMYDYVDSNFMMG